MSPIIILFHTAFQWGNQLATTTYLSVVVVVVTGLIGRYIYGWVRLAPGEAVEAGRLRDLLSDFVAKIPGDWMTYATASDPALRHVLTVVRGDVPNERRSLLRLFLGMPGESLRMARGLRHARQMFVESGTYHMFRDQVQEFRRLRTKIRFHRNFKGFMSKWRALHVVLAIVLLALIAMHVWVSIRVGFRWLWS